MTFTEEKTTDYCFPNITVLKKFRDGELCAYIAKADDGFVLHNRSVSYTELLETDDAQTTVNHYFKKIICPLSYDFKSFVWEAVPEESVNKNYIF